LPLQVDYESEEEDRVDDAEDKEDEDEEDEAAAAATAAEEPTPEVSQLDVSQQLSTRGKGKGKATRRTKQPGSYFEETLDQMRTNSVLGSNPAIEQYRYDQQHELWCEVSVCACVSVSRLGCERSRVQIPDEPKNHFG